MELKSFPLWSDLLTFAILQVQTWWDKWHEQQKAGRGPKDAMQLAVAFSRITDTIMGFMIEKHTTHLKNYHLIMSAG